jgi:hypothetical protein
VEERVGPVELLLHPLRGEHHHLGLLDRGGGGGAHLAVDQGHLAEQVALVQHRQAHRPAVAQGRDLHPPALDDVGAVSRLSLPEDRRSGGEDVVLEWRGHRSER